MSSATVDWLGVLEWGEAQVEDVKDLAYLYVREGLYREAIVLFRALGILKPREASYQQMLGALYLQVGRPERALRALRRALELDPADLPTLINKAKAYLASGGTQSGLDIARALTQVDDKRIANSASALLMAYGETPF